VPARVRLSVPSSIVSAAETSPFQYSQASRTGSRPSTSPASNERTAVTRLTKSNRVTSVERTTSSAVSIAPIGASSGILTMMSASADAPAARVIGPGNCGCGLNVLPMAPNAKTTGAGSGLVIVTRCVTAEPGGPDARDRVGNTGAIGSPNRMSAARANRLTARLGNVGTPGGSSKPKYAVGFVSADGTNGANDCPPASWRADTFSNAKSLSVRTASGPASNTNV
jgi:hypothetical protein